MSVPIFLIAGVVAHILKPVLGRPRPKMFAGHDMYNLEWFEFAARMNAYPSGHTITTFCLLATVWTLYGWKTRVALFVIACLLGYARVGIGSHWMADVVAGAVLGYMIGKYFRHRWQLDRKEK